MHDDISNMASTTELVALHDKSKTWFAKNAKKGKLHRIKVGRQWFYDPYEVLELIKSEISHGERKWDCVSYGNCVFSWAKRNIHRNDNPCRTCSNYRSNGGIENEIKSIYDVS